MEKARAWFRESFKGGQDSGIGILRDIFKAQLSGDEALDLALGIGTESPSDGYGHLGSTYRYDEIATHAGKLRRMVAKVRNTAGTRWTERSPIAGHLACCALAGRCPTNVTGDDLAHREGALFELLEAVDRVAATIPDRAKSRGKPAKQGNRDRELRVLLPFLNETGQSLEPATLALAAIAFGFDRPCTEGRFSSRCRVWSEVLRRRRPPRGSLIEPQTRGPRKLDDS